MLDCDGGELGPTTLPAILADGSVAESSLLVIVSVRIRIATLTPHLSQQRLRMQVKFGRPGSSVACDMHGLTAPPAVADAACSERSGASAGADDETCLFLAHRQYDSLLRLRLVHGGLVCAKTAKCELRLPPVWGQMERRDVELLEDGMLATRRLASLDISVGTWAMTKGSLRDYLVLTDAVARGGAMLMGPAPSAIIGASPCFKASHRFSSALWPHEAPRLL